ncbi:MAG: tetratricopeptide repeat protein [Chloroflexi bacterium]|nr:tetratricopeptide repeat protein [Chloroflexota bacterium]
MSYLDEHREITVAFFEEAVELFIATLPGYILFFLIAGALFVFASVLHSPSRRKWHDRVLRRKPIRVIVLVVVSALAAFMLATSVAMYFGTIYLAKNDRPYFEKIETVPSSGIVAVSGIVDIQVEAKDPEKTTLVYSYAAKGIGGTVFRGWTDLNKVAYTAPEQKLGNAWVYVTIKDGGRPRPQTAKDKVLIRVVNKTEAASLNDYFVKARDYLGGGNYTGAVSSFSAVIGKLPDLPKPYLGRGLSFAAQGRWGEALADYDKFIERTDFNEAGYLLRAQAYLKLRNTESAGSDITVLSNRTKNPELKNLAEEFLKANSITTRETILERGLPMIYTHFPKAPLTFP